MQQWTREQRAAIDARNYTILVSAAAGSGKTAVLVERIVGLLREGFRLDRMLIVTFTRAAAAEMRQRLNQRIAKEAADHPDQMGQALDDLEAAEISTIHSFCQKVIRNDFQAVGVDPLTRVCDEQQKQVLFEQAFCDAMNELLDDPSQNDFQAFAEAFEQQEIREITQRLYTFLMSLPDPFEWLDQKINAINREPYEEHPWYQTLVDHSARQLQGAAMLLQAQQSMFDEPDAVEPLRETWEKDVQGYQRLMALNAGTPQKMYEALATFSFGRAASCRNLTEEQQAWKKRYTKMRDELKALIKQTAEGLKIDEPKLRLELPVIEKHLRGLALLTKKTQEFFLSYKLRQNVVDFNDLEQMTLQILQQEEYRARLQQDYDHIFVDECQDVSAVQDAILQSIHGENSCLFMVGDVKQSIYRFRLADPTLFLMRMRTYSDDEKARERRIFLQKNFRSRTNILDATNRVFRQLMKADVTELDYLPEDELVPGRATQNDPPVEIHLLDTSSEEEEDVDELEAESRVVVERVKFFLTQTLEERGQERLYQYRDMVILLPKVSRIGPALAELLQQQGVPVYFDGAENYFGLPEIKQMSALLSVIDNPLQDVPLLAVLKMTPFRLTDEELADIRLCKTGRDIPFYEAFQACRCEETRIGQRCADIWNMLQEWRFRQQIMSVKDFVWYIIRETGFYAACGALPEGTLRQANLRLLCQRAAEYEEHGGVTLSGFLKQMNEQQQAGDSRSAKELGENENLVRIMTIHKSKGLEFPVVFCMRLSGRLHLPKRSGLKMHSRLGVCLPYVNRTLNIRRETLGDDAFEIQRLLDEKAERARLLYVAMTRARERLILIGCEPPEGKPCWHMADSGYRIWAADSMMDWVMQTVSTELSTSYPQAATPWNVRDWSNFGNEAVDNNRLIHNLAGWLQSVTAVPARQQSEALWQEPEEQAIMPLKTSVSSLSKKKMLNDPMPLTDEEEDGESKHQDETIVAPLRLSDIPSRPAFMEEKQITGAERGTLIHRALSLMNLDDLRTADPAGRYAILRDNLHKMMECGCLTADEAKLVNLRRLTAFYNSPIGQRILESQEVRREWGFNLKLTEQDTLLQGVIDCAFIENGQWVLLDYKTDRIEDEEAFVQHYAMQLEWYARALERITDKKVKEMWLYALSRDQAYSVKRQQLAE